MILSPLDDQLLSEEGELHWIAVKGDTEDDASLN